MFFKVQNQVLPRDKFSEYETWVFMLGISCSNLRQVVFHDSRLSRKALLCPAFMIS